jgi:hypothetical protein
MATYNPIANPFEHDLALIGGAITPGLVKIEGLSSKQKWDVKEGKGEKGATITYGGDSLSKFSLRCTLWESAHFDVWAQNIKPVLATSWAPPHPAVDIWHPELVERGVRSVVVEDISQFTANGDGFDIVVKCIEYRAPKPATGTTSKSNTTTGKAETKREVGQAKLKSQREEIAFKQDELAKRRAARKK